MVLSDGLDAVWVLHGRSRPSHDDGMLRLWNFPPVEGVGGLGALQKRPLWAPKGVRP